MNTLAHISDLHFGAERTEIVEGLIKDLVALRPSLVAVSGDLTQRARRKEFAAARQFLDRIPFPKLVVPGNHDIPLFDLVSRFAWPLARFRSYIQRDVNPFFSTADFVVLGMNTARSTSSQQGRISVAQVDGLRRRLETIPAHVLKVLVTHHSFLPPPGDPSPQLVERAELALRAAEAGGVDLLLAGHLHRGYSGDVRTHHTGIRRAILVAHASTATSHRLRNEANSYNLIRLDHDHIGVSVRVWDGSVFRAGRSTEYVKVGLDWRAATDAEAAAGS
jgi:3',5'-cyclic AMP phosphodiesterase CpdA